MADPSQGIRPDRTQGRDRLTVVGDDERVARLDLAQDAAALIAKFPVTDPFSCHVANVARRRTLSICLSLPRPI